MGNCNTKKTEETVDKNIKEREKTVDKNIKKTEKTVDKNIKEREIDYKHSSCVIRSPNDSCKENDYELLKINPDSVPLFHFGTKPFKARVVDVYDGDTCTILFKYHGINVKHKIRLYGYDSPEIKPRKDVPNGKGYG
jgi:hypothetical protein